MPFRSIYTVIILYCVILILICSEYNVYASNGDTSWDFRQCKTNCYSKICDREVKLSKVMFDFYHDDIAIPDNILNEYNTPQRLSSSATPAQREEYQKQQQLALTLSPAQRTETALAAIKKELNELQSWNTLDLWLLGWDCKENCRYNCMQEQTSKIYEKIAKEPDNYSAGEDIMKYYGKWPFRRIFGIQEFCSTLFSMFNFIPFYQYYWTILDELPTTYFMRNYWYLYTISGMNTWIWSTAFHARDNIFTERLDYFCATLSILFLLNIAIARIFKLTTVHKQMIPILASVCYFTWHCYTLHYIHFDYGWNMMMMVIFGSIYCSMWYIWAFMNPTATHRWKICTANTIILIMSGFEVFDFPPIFGQLLDAHAIWHFSTPFCTYLTFSFAIDDAQYLHDLNMKSKEFLD